MALVVEKPKAAFDLSLIKRGDLLWGRHLAWSEGKAGFVTSATEERLTVQYFPGIGNVTNHFAISVSEVSGGQWEVRWSPDLKEINEYAAGQEGEGMGNAVGGTDL